MPLQMFVFLILNNSKVNVSFSVSYINLYGVFMTGNKTNIL